MGIMMGPMIPGLNEHEMQRIMKAAADNGATFTAYTFIRLNGAVKLLFHDWRGYLISGFALIWIANLYMNLFFFIRIDIKKKGTEAKVEEKDLNT